MPKLSRKKVIIIAIIAVVVLGAAAFVIVKYVLPGTATPAAVTDSSPDQYHTKIENTQDKILELMAVNDERSVDQAMTLIDEQLSQAEASKGEEYIVYARLAKANFLIDTDRAQEALDTILLPLVETYGKDDKYKENIYATVSGAYDRLGNTEKSNEYLNQISGRGGS